MNTLARIGLEPAQIPQLVQKFVLPSARTLALSQRKGSFGRRGLPDSVINLMVEDYQRLGSVRQVAKLWNRSNQSVWQTLKNRGVEIKPRVIGQKINYGGLVYTPGKRGTYRCTTGDRHDLHHRIWEDRTGRKIPAGWQVSFKDADPSNLALTNLECAPIADISRMHQKRLHPATARMTPEELVEHRRENGLKHYYAQRAKNYAAGLRCDGKPRARRPNLVNRAESPRDIKMQEEARQVHIRERVRVNANERAQRLVESGLTTRGTQRVYKKQTETEKLWAEFRNEVKMPAAANWDLEGKMNRYDE